MRFACPHCNQHIEAEDNWAGQQETCPNCQQTFKVPLASTLPPKAEESQGIVFNCARCSQRLEIDAAGAGLTISCPKCGQNLIVPSLPKATPVSVIEAPPIIGSVPPIKS